MKKWTLAPLQIAPHGAMGAKLSGHLVRSVVAGGMGRGCPDTLCLIASHPMILIKDTPNASGQRLLAGNSVIGSLLCHIYMSWIYYMMPLNSTG